MLISTQHKGRKFIQIRIEKKKTFTKRKFYPALGGGLERESVRVEVVFAVFKAS